MLGALPEVVERSLPIAMARPTVSPACSLPNPRVGFVVSVTARAVGSHGGHATRRVLCGRYGLQVLGIAALSHATEMVDLQTVRDRSDEGLVGDAVDVVDGPVDRERPVATLRDVPRPDPTPIAVNEADRTNPAGQIKALQSLRSIPGHERDLTWSC